MEVGKEEEPMMNGGDQEEGAPCVTNAFVSSTERSTIQPHFDSLQISTGKKPHRAHNFHPFPCYNHLKTPTNL